uniref:Divalent cation transporter n=1 Tax=Panagrellus redivivus TaxID=6233 RepID=A0A7E4V633_PANRE
MTRPSMPRNFSATIVPAQASPTTSEQLTDASTQLSTESTQVPTERPDLRDEGLTTFFVESMPPLLFAGISLIFTGLLLQKWQTSQFYVEVHEALMLTPVLLGMKGNLEMTLASRLTTLSHTGKLDEHKTRWPILGANWALVQLQASVLAWFASGLAMLVTSVGKGVFLREGIILTASALSAVHLSSVVLGSVIMTSVLLARKFHVNPDNVISPVAASVGDLTTLCLLVGTGTLLIHICPSTNCWLVYTIMGTTLVAIPICFFITFKNTYTRPTLKWGWFSILLAAVISSIGGFIFQGATHKFKTLAMFQPLIAGLAGNRAAIQCCRLSTSFYVENGDPGRIAVGDTWRRRLNPIYVFDGHDIHSRTTLLLIACAIPSHAGFMSAIILLNGNHCLFNLSLFGAYLAAALIQVTLLLYLAQLLVYGLWRLGTDPDHSAIPVITSLSDFLGSFFLFIVFSTLDEKSKCVASDFVPLTSLAMTTTVAGF